VTVATLASSWPQDVGDTCGNVFGQSLRAVDPSIPLDANVLEIGCAEFDWLTVAKQAWPDMTLTGIDQREPKPGYDRSGSLRMQRDVLDYCFPRQSFDWIVAISTIEHIGLGHYGDPVDPDGDTHAMECAYHWLKPGGWMYLDVPFADTYRVFGTKCRIYDTKAIISRLCGGPWELRRCDDFPEPRTDLPFNYAAIWLRKPPNA
jgi:SAM-dependent methyltransferase